jgi:hypothetical protein
LVGILFELFFPKNFPLKTGLKNAAKKLIDVGLRIEIPALAVVPLIFDGKKKRLWQVVFKIHRKVLRSDRLWFRAFAWCIHSLPIILINRALGGVRVEDSIPQKLYEMALKEHLEKGLENGKPFIYEGDMIAETRIDLIKNRGNRSFIRYWTSRFYFFLGHLIIRILVSPKFRASQLHYLYPIVERKRPIAFIYIALYGKPKTDIAPSPHDPHTIRMENWVRIEQIVKEIAQGISVIHTPMISDRVIHTGRRETFNLNLAMEMVVSMDQKVPKRTWILDPRLVFDGATEVAKDTLRKQLLEIRFPGFTKAVDRERRFREYFFADPKNPQDVFLTLMGYEDEHGNVQSALEEFYATLNQPTRVHQRLALMVTDGLIDTIVSPIHDPLLNRLMGERIAILPPSERKKFQIITLRDIHNMRTDEPIESNAQRDLIKKLRQGGGVICLGGESLGDFSLREILEQRLPKDSPLLMVDDKPLARISREDGDMERVDYRGLLMDQFDRTGGGFLHANRFSTYMDDLVAKIGTIMRNRPVPLNIKN